MILEFAQVFAVCAEDDEERHDGQQNCVCGLRNKDELCRALAPSDCHAAAAYEDDDPNDLELRVFQSLAPAEHAIHGVRCGKGGGDGRRETGGKKAEADQKAAAEKQQQEEAAKAEQPLKEYGMVAVSLGEGFSGIFGDLGVDHIVEGGQTMNPSIEDILDAVEKVGAKNVFVLPNNSNVILAASQAAELSERNVIVLPTKNVAMGIGAVVAFNPEASVEENREAMTAAAEQVKTGQITFAVRDTVFEDKEIKEGDIIGIHNGRIEVVGQSIHDIALDLVKHVVEDGDSLITIYYGQDTKQEDADALGAEVAEMFSDLDVEVQYGGQPLYYYLISAE